MSLQFSYSSFFQNFLVFLSFSWKFFPMFSLKHSTRFLFHYNRFHFIFSVPMFSIFLFHSSSAMFFKILVSKDFLFFFCLLMFFFSLISSLLSWPYLFFSVKLLPEMPTFYFAYKTTKIVKKRIMRNYEFKIYI